MDQVNEFFYRFYNDNKINKEIIQFIPTDLYLFVKVEIKKYINNKYLSNITIDAYFILIKEIIEKEYSKQIEYFLIQIEKNKNNDA